MDEKIKEVVDAVMEENGYGKYTGKSVRSIIREFNSRIALGGFKLDKDQVRKVTGVKTRDFWILNFYTEVDKGGETGYGYAYNLSDPLLSEWGGLYTPHH